MIKKEKKKTTDSMEMTDISVKNALKIMYFLMAVDGEIFHNEEEKFDAIGAELDLNYAENKEQIIEECKSQMDKIMSLKDYYNVVQEGVELALAEPVQPEDIVISHKLLVWNLLSVAYSDGNYDETERKLLKYIVDKLHFDKAVFFEMENSILTLLDLERELLWIKTTDRPYLTIERMVNEIVDRKNIIFDSVKDLISL